MKKHRAYAKENAAGFWVGCIEYPSGVHSEVTNAKHCESAAMGIAERMAEESDVMLDEQRKSCAWWAMRESREGKSCAECSSMEDGGHYCLLHKMPIKNANIIGCPAWEPKHRTCYASNAAGQGREAYPAPACSALDSEGKR